MQRWIVTALGKDQHGIVAGVTKALYQAGCNLEDSAMTRLEGEFTVMLIFSSRVKTTAERLQKAFAPVARKLKLVVHIKPLSRTETSKPRSQGKPYLISVYGADRPGIVYRIADSMAKAHINITDVETHRSAKGAGKRQPSLYMMLLEVEVSPRVSLAALTRKLKQLGRSLRVEINVRPTVPEIL